MKQALSKQSHSSAVLDAHTAAIQSSLEHSARRRKLYDGLSQRGITIEQLRAAYNDAFKTARESMIDFHLSFFYASAALAVHERYKIDADDLAAFMRTLHATPQSGDDEHTIVARVLELTGFDASIYSDESEAVLKSGRGSIYKNAATRKDIAAINRMKKTGITEKDLYYEREVGYNNGWNSGLSMAPLYAALAMTLKKTFNTTVPEIDDIIARMDEITDEEISTSDILKRCRLEAGVDVSGLVGR